METGPKFVTLPTVSHGDVIINPKHVAAVKDAYGPSDLAGTQVLLTNGISYQIDLPATRVVSKLLNPDWD